MCGFDAAVSSARTTVKARPAISKTNIRPTRLNSPRLTYSQILPEGRGLCLWACGPLFEGVDCIADYCLNAQRTSGRPLMWRAQPLDD
jgi:hypothetical protein